MDAELCSNCEEPVAHTPVYFDGRPYCCVGCVAGGPCLCTYEEPGERHEQNTTPRPVMAGVASPSRSSVPPMPDDPRPVPPAPSPDQSPRPAPVPSTVIPPVRAARSAPPPPLRHEAPREPLADPRAPIPFRRPGGSPVVVHVAGFADQRQLLMFAGVMEQSTEFTEVSLTRVSADEAWLTVRDDSPEKVAEALRRLPGFAIDASVDQNVVEARVGVRRSTPTGAPEIPVHAFPAHEGAPLLPQRPRFRAFRPQSEPRPAAPTIEATPPPAGRPQVPPPSARPPLPPVPRIPGPARREERQTAPAPQAIPAADVSRPPAPTPQSPAPEVPSAVPPEAPRRAPAASAPAEPRTTPRPAAPAPSRPAAPAVVGSTPVPASVPSPAPAAPPPLARPEAAIDDEFVEPEDRPGGAVLTVEHLTLVVYPFHSFAALNEFQAAIRELHGVKNTRVRRFYRGTLHLAVDYEDIIPLSDRLADLKGIDYQVASESRSELEIVLQDSSPLAAAGDS